MVIRTIIRTLLGIGLIFISHWATGQSNDRTPKPKGIVPPLVREGEGAAAAVVTKAEYMKGKGGQGATYKRRVNGKYVKRWTQAPYVPAKIGIGGGDLALKNAVQLNQSILNWEYRPGYMLKDGWWTRLKKEWYPDMLFLRSRAGRAQTEEIQAGIMGNWSGDWKPSNRGSYEAITAAYRAEFIGRVHEDQRPVQMAASERNSQYQGNITTDKRVVQRMKAEEISAYQGKITTDKREVQRAKAEELAAWTGNYEDDKIERERAKAEEISAWTGNYFTNKEEVQKDKAEEISSYEGNWYNDKAARQRRTARDSRNFKSGIRISRWYLLSHDSQSKYRIIPKGKRDKKEKDLWYD